MTEPKSRSGPSASSPDSSDDQQTESPSAETSKGQPSPDSRRPANEQARGTARNPEGASFRRTLEDELGSADFAERGWYRLADLADYLAHLVDGRTTGILATDDPKVYERVLGLASAVKAAAQWFALDDGPKPAFVTQAEKYLGAVPELLTENKAISIA